MTAFGSEPYLVSVGDHVTVTSGVLSVTHDGGVWVFRADDPEIDVFGRIRVGSNVFIGLGATLMPGVSVGDNCVIGAAAVVTRDIPSDCVAVGVPARPVKSLSEYRDTVEAAAVRIRSLGDAEKRQYLQNHLP
jgi:acetyltransferase-like isoleucine patch superfamily enzyme